MSTFNFSGLQQKADQTLHNADEAVRKWVDFIQAPAGDVNFQYYDKNGNLKTVTFPNRNKVVNDFIANVNSVMNKTFYVDAINGNDNNDGSQSAPFKTIKKAIDSVPTGGIGYINVRGTHIINEISINNKVIRIYFYDNAIIKPEIYTRKFGSSTYYHYIGFILSNSSLEFHIENTDTKNCMITTDDIDDTYNVSPFSGFVVIPQSVSYGIFKILIRTMTDNKSPIKIGRRTVLFTINEWSVDRPAHVGLSISGHYSGTNRHIIVDGAIANFKSTPGSLYINYTGGFKDSNGNNVDIKTKIHGIVKDTSNVPRNISSNIIL